MFCAAVKNDGAPQPYEQLSSHLRKPIRINKSLTAEEWSKHLEDLRALSVLANQATEYAHTKNKGAILKPDLIPQEKSKIESNKTREPIKKAGPIKKMPTDIKATESIEQLTKELTLKASPEKTKISKDTTDTFIKNEQLNVAAKAPETNTIAATTASISTAPKSQQSPSKARAKPTEIKKPTAVDTGRFRTSTTSAVAEAEAGASPKESELEKIAAAKVAERSKSKSPASKVDDRKLEIKSNNSKPNETELTSGVSKETDKAVAKQEEVANTSSNNSASETIGISTVDTAKKTISNVIVAPAAESGASPAIKGSSKRPSLKRHKDSLSECKPLNVLVYAETATAKESAVNTLKEILASNT